MQYNITQAIEILERTPQVLTTQLQGIDNAWATGNEGGETWNPFDVVGHLVHGERTDWIARTNIILAQDPNNNEFEPFDRFAQFNDSQGKTIDMLLEEFATLRAANLEELRSLNITDDQLTLEGLHPALGTVTLGNLLSTWVVHDLNHLAQISRVMAHQYKDNVGPWSAYLRILKENA